MNCSFKDIIASVLNNATGKTSIPYPNKKNYTFRLRIDLE